MGGTCWRYRLLCGRLLKNSILAEMHRTIIEQYSQQQFAKCSKRPFRQGRGGFDARNVHAVCEREPREELQVC